MAHCACGRAVFVFCEPVAFAAVVFDVFPCGAVVDGGISVCGDRLDECGIGRKQVDLSALLFCFERVEDGWFAVGIFFGRGVVVIRFHFALFLSQYLMQ